MISQLLSQITDAQTFCGDERGSGREIPQLIPQQIPQQIPQPGEYILVGNGSKRLAFYREYTIRELQSGDFKGGELNIWTVTLQDLYADDRELGEIELIEKGWMVGSSLYQSYKDAAQALLNSVGADRRKRSAW